MLRDPIPVGFPANHAVLLIDICRHWGVGEGELLAGMGVRREDLGEPEVMIDVSRMEVLIDRARALTREPGIGIYLGLRMSVETHGFVGMAAQNAATYGDALRLAVRYTPTRTSALALRLDLSESKAALVVEERVDFGSARDVVLLSLLMSLWQIGNLQLGRVIRESTIHVRFAEPAYYPRLKHLGPRFLFRQPNNQLAFDPALLASPLATADAASLQLACDQCERVLDAARGRSRFAERARRLVLRSAGGARSLEEIAAIINISSRTLRRRLADEGGSYWTIVDDERRARAFNLLRSFEVPIREIARRLGYSDVPGFTRAFRRWTGQTPAAYRRKARRGLL